MDTLKHRNSKNLTKVEDIKKRWQDYTEELNKENLNEPITMMMWSLTYSQTSWNQSQVGLKKHYYKQAEVMEFHLSYFKS